MRSVKIVGGLGNQMFQYAFLMAMRSEAGSGVMKNLAHMMSYDKHNGYELERLFGLRTSVAERLWMPIFRIDRLRGLLVREVHERGSFQYSSGLIDPKCRMSESRPWYRWRPMVSYVGYWQNECYFKALRPAILEQFSFRGLELSAPTRDILQSIRADRCSVAIHVRRGDYQTEARTRALHGDICTVEYYRKAICQMRSLVADDARFYIFSNDHDWVRSELASELGADAVHVECNVGLDSWQDMFLMSMCRHNIIANSSFSWWGAWLNTHDDRVVMAPSRWMNNTECCDIVPPDWIRVNT